MSAQKPDKKAVGDRIVAARRRLGWKAIELATRMGWQAADVNRYEKGRSMPGSAKLEEFAKALGVTSASLLWGEDVAAPGTSMPPERRAKVLAWAKRHGYEDVGERMVEMLAAWGEVNDDDLGVVATRTRHRAPAPAIPADRAALPPGRRRASGRQNARSIAKTRRIDA